MKFSLRTLIVVMALTPPAIWLVVTNWATMGSELRAWVLVISSALVVYIVLAAEQILRGRQDNPWRKD